MTISCHVRAWTWILLLAIAQPAHVPMSLCLRGGTDPNCGPGTAATSSSSMGIRTINDGGQWRVIPDNSIELAKEIFVDAASGSDEKGSGSSGSPYASIFKALCESSAHQVAKIVLSPGIYSGRLNRNIRVRLGAFQRIEIVGSGWGASGRRGNDDNESGGGQGNDNDNDNDNGDENDSKGTTCVDGTGGRVILDVCGVRSGILALRSLELAGAKTAVRLRENATIEASRVHLTSCTGGAVRCSGRSRLLLDRCCLENNTVTHMPLPEGSRREPQKLESLMGSAVFMSDQTMLRSYMCGFLNNGGNDCAAGGACAVLTRIPDPIPAHCSFYRCVFEGNVAGDAGGGLALFWGARANITECEFRNNTAWGKLRGGGGIYTQAAPTSWVWNSSFYGNKCPENGGAITRISSVPAEEEEPPTDADCPEYEINYDNLDNMDVRFSTFDENYPAWVMLGQYERGFYSEECNNTRMLFDRGGVETLPDCFPNEPTEGINTTLPWELEDTFGMMQEDYWREKWPPYGDPPSDLTDSDEEGPFRLEKHWTHWEPDPDTGDFEGIREGGKPLPRLRDLKNQTAVKIFRSILKEHGADSEQFGDFIHGKLDEAYERWFRHEYGSEALDNFKMPTAEELMWCNEPLENLTRWSYCDTLEFSRRGRGWMNWTFEQSAEFEEWRKDRQRQYKELELEAWNEYARRRGFGNKVQWPVHMSNVTDNVTVHAEWLDSDHDPDEKPWYPWNRPPTNEELWQQGGPMRDYNAEQIKELTAKSRKKRRGGDDDDDDEMPNDEDAMDDAGDEF